ncbi:GNAT family N-acetyltransferase [Pseudomarimonas arenosa]|uniref:GNAT family N-acetyltransferase n=1 Tax=Pseudomarimonas arenosa TaxID=2774145 RepID=A0AAW3ZKH6_9GAMM|nr:GNAT family N-acetyltransferase [Pseudomarimonas arenosa]MBD8526024.1 GNAT family N-acetyltransferase [Pseudomarimonas arenosa]
MGGQSSSTGVRLLEARGSELQPWLDAVAALRIEVFRDWPYLYRGSLDYERSYLSTYSSSPRAFFVLAVDGDQVVGASTAIPLSDEAESFHRAFVQRGIALNQVFYFGESVLRNAYRGRGLGHAFFDAREAEARRGGFRMTAFCAVEREQNDPRRPLDYRPNDAFWAKRGYQKQSDMHCEIEWPETDHGPGLSHRLSYWLRNAA